MHGQRNVRIEACCLSRRLLRVLTCNSCFISPFVWDAALRPWVAGSKPTGLIFKDRKILLGVSDF